MINAKRGDHPLQPGEYRAMVAEGQDKAVMACLSCGGLLSLHNHGIAADGTVTPSVVCGHLLGGGEIPANVECPRCGFHESVRLLGWTGEQQ